MISFRAIVTTSLTMGLVFTCLPANGELRADSRLVTSPLVSAAAVAAAQGQSGDPKALLQEKLNSQFKLTSINSEGDIASAGSVLVLQKDDLEMCSTAANVPPTNTYKGGKISFGFGASFAWVFAAGDISQIPQRKFVKGEKFWVKSFDVQEDGVVFQFYSDPINDVRYYGKLKFPYPKHTMPPADEMMKTIAEAITVQPDDNAVAQKAPAAPAQPTTTMPPIEQPQPPPDAPPAAPKTIEKGQTREVVVAILGQPSKVVKLGAKEIDIYPDMKVTFVNNKVTDVQ
ncbi:MAG: hypothetical protein ACHP8B_08910 [Terriglobales bacterium]